MDIVRGAISVAAFREIKEASGYRSIFDLCVQPRYSLFRISARDFVERLSTYPCWYTDPGQTKFVPAEDAAACPILFRDLTRNNPLFDEKMKEFTAPPHVKPAVLVEQCQSCDCFIVKDGNHRVLRYAKFDPAALLDITEISCAAWPLAEQDMRVLHRFRKRFDGTECLHQAQSP